MHEAKLRYTEPLVREAVRAFCVRSIYRTFGRRLFVALTFVASFSVYQYWRGDRGWLLGLTLATIGLFATMLVVVYFAHIRNSLGVFRKMSVPEAAFSCTEENFTLSSELGTFTMPWSAIVDVWQFDRFWLLLFSPSQFTTLPLDDVSEETRAFILSRAGRS